MNPTSLRALVATPGAPVSTKTSPTYLLPAVLSSAEKKQQKKGDKKAAASEFSKVVKKKELELKKKVKEYFNKQ